MIEWATLSPFVPLLIVVLAGAIAALSAAALLIARRSVEPAGDSLGAAEGLEVVYLGSCRGSHADGIQKALAEGEREMRRSNLRSAPWFLMLGESASGKSTLLAESGLPHPYGGGASQSPLDLWLFSDTVVLDPKGELILRRDGHSHDEQGWRCLLRQIRNARPRRPLDGVLLTIPADRLRVDDVEKDKAALQADASLRANALFERLAELQQILGMRLPVDVVITQSDKIPGWRPWARALTPQQGQQIFGWSSPYAPQAPFQASWTGEAFASIEGRLAQIQAGMLADANSDPGPGAGDSANLLDFPTELAALEPATRIYLNHLFSQSAFVEGFLMRGLYFTGGDFDASTLGHPDVVGLCPAPQAPPPARGPAPSRLLFARDLLQAKAFPENALGQFTEEASRSARVSTRVAQIAAFVLPVLVLGGMLLDHHRLADDSATLAPPVHRIADGLEGSATGPANVQQAGDRVDDLKTIDHYILRGLFLPPSWWSPQHRNVRRTFDGSYDSLIFPTLRSQLQHWQRELSTPWPPPPPGPRITTVEETPEFEQLQAFADQLQRYDEDIWLYDCLAAHCVSGSGALSSFDRLSKDLLDVPLELPSSAARRFHARRLEGVQATPFNTDPNGRAAINAQAQRLSERLNQRLFVNNPVLQDLRDLNDEIERLELDPNATAADYRLLDERILSLEQELQRPEIAWMGQDALTPGPVVRATYAELAASPSVGPDSVADMARSAEQDFAEMRRTMATLSNPSTGPILAENADGSATLELSQGVQDLDAAVEKLLDETFMAEEPQKALTVPDDLQRLFWNQNGLKKTTDLVTSYQSFLDGGVSPFPDDLQGTTQEVALGTLEEHMLDALASAQSFRPAPSQVSAQTLERGLAMQVRNYTASGATLAQILDDFQSLQLYDAYDQLTTVLSVEQTHLLEDLDALLDLEPLFQPVDSTFSWWHGVQPPAPPTFGVTSPAVCPEPEAGWCSGATDADGPPGCSADAATVGQLTSWIGDETATASALVTNYAEPILGSPTAVHLLSSKTLNQLTDRWQRFTTDVDQFEKKQPGNAIQTLSQFITDTMMQLSLGTCPSLLPPSLRAAASPQVDYFRNRQAELVRGLGTRCDSLAAETALPDYRAYAYTFNDRLAGRYPFVVPDPATPITAEATPAALREFFTAFDRSACLMDAVEPGAPVFSGDEVGVRTFVRSMQEVRAFLAPFLDQPTKYPVPTYGYRVEFRVNRNREIGAEQIIDWRLQVGDETQLLGLRTQPPPPPPPTSPGSTAGAAPTSASTTALGGEWIFGEASTLSLRWAQESPAIPTAPPTSDRARLDGRSVIWGYENLWSLLALVRDYPASATDIPGTEDPQPETLKLVVGTSSASSAGQASGAARDATVFVRVTFLTPDFSAELDLPPFPPSAPRLTQPGFDAKVDGLEVQLTDQTRGDVDSWLWTFGDGDSTDLQDPSHTYGAAGTYTITLAVTTDGVTERTRQDVPVGEGEVPKASFTAADNGLEITFTDTSTGSPTSWTWSFGDGDGSSDQHPTHRYAKAGSYEVTLDVSNKAGRDTVKESVEARDLPPEDRPEARFLAMPEGGNFVRFVDESKGEIESRTWYFGDGKTSTDKNPGHLYESAGDYEVRLIVRGPGGEAETVGRVTVR
ncbi:MAG: type VI secretion protein IcmF/TssM N-terminal domain-containing protein [Acidobacteriota bacterium]